MKGTLQAYLTDLEYILGRLELIRYLKDRKQPAGAGQIMSELVDHMRHNSESLKRLMDGSQWEAPPEPGEDRA